jgi:hypothetical protein
VVQEDRGDRNQGLLDKVDSNKVAGSAENAPKRQYLEWIPSDAGLEGVLADVPLWQGLAVSLGVPNEQVLSNNLKELGGVLSLSYWRNGKSGPLFPNNWKFLLETVKESPNLGPRTAKTIAEKVALNQSWSVKMTCSPLPNPIIPKLASNLFQEYKSFLHCYYANMKTVEDSWLNKNQLAYIKLSLIEASEDWLIKGRNELLEVCSSRGSSVRRTCHKQVLLLEDILNYNPGERGRKIALVEGAPGSGKSTTLRHLCKQYVSGHMLHEYSMVILIPLRMLPRTGCQKLTDLFIIMPSTMQSRKDELADTLSTGNDTLLLVDGWDERPRNCTILYNILKGIDLPASTVIITSRHVSAEGIYPCVNRRIEIEPFSQMQRTQFIKGYFGTNSTKCNLLERQLLDRADLSSVCSYPMILSMACFICETDGLLPSNVTDVYVRFIILSANRYLKEKQKVKDRVNSIQTMVNSQYFSNFRRVTMLALTGMKENKLVFSDNDLQCVGLEIPYHSYGFLMSISQLDGMGVEEGSHHFLHSSVQACLAAVELELLGKEHQLEFMRSCEVKVAKKSPSESYHQYLKQRDDAIFTEQQRALLDCALYDIDNNQEHRFLLFQFFAGLNKLTDQDISTHLVKILLSENCITAWYKSRLPVILFESQNKILAGSIMGSFNLTRLTIPHCDSYFLYCLGWCISQSPHTVDDITVKLSPGVSLHHLFSQYPGQNNLSHLNLMGSTDHTDLSSVNEVIKNCSKVKILRLRFSVECNEGKSQEFSLEVEETAHIVTELLHPQRLYIGAVDSPLADNLATQILLQAHKSSVKSLYVVSSSPLVLTNAVLQSSNIISLQTLLLLYDTAQKCTQLNFDDCEWDEVEQVLKDTKLRMFEILAHTPGPFCKHFMEHVCKAASKRRDKEPLTIVFDTERPPDSGAKEEECDTIEVCQFHNMESALTVFRCLVPDISHLTWMKSLSETLLSVRRQFASIVDCFVSCHGLELRAHIHSQSAKRHILKLLEVAAKEAFTTISLCTPASNKEILDGTFLPGYTMSACEEDLNIYLYLSYNGIMSSKDGEVNHFWDDISGRHQECKVHAHLEKQQSHVQRVWIVTFCLAP